MGLGFSYCDFSERAAIGLRPKNKNKLTMQRTRDKDSNDSWDFGLSTPVIEGYIFMIRKSWEKNTLGAHG